MKKMKRVSQTTCPAPGANPNTVLATYDERKKSIVRTDMAELVDAGMKDFQRGIEHFNLVGAEVVAGCNEIREAGRKFIEAEQIGQREFRDWYSSTQDWEADQLRRAKIETAKKVFRAMESKRAVLVNDCVKAMPIVMEFNQMIQHRRRLPQETHAEPNVFSAFFSSLNKAVALFTDMKERPISDWTVTELDEIERATRPVAEMHADVEAELKKKS